MGSAGILKTVWVVVYWITFLLTWAVIPVVSEFQAAGEFTFRARLLASLRANLRFYLVLVVLGVAFVIWVLSASSVQFGDLPSFALTLANTYGLCLIILMLGYGLVEVPRKLWRLSTPADALRRLEFKAVQLDASLFDARCAVEEVAAEAHATQRALPAASSSIEAAELHDAMGVIMAKCPPLSPRYQVGGGAGSADPLIVSVADDVTLAVLAAVHTRLKAATLGLRKAQHRWEQLLEQIEHLEQVLEGALPPSSRNVAAVTGQSRAVVMCRSAVWYWHLYAASPTYKVLAAISMALSGVVLWSEIVAPFGSQSLLPFGVLVDGAQRTGLRQVAALVPLVYMCLCTYLSLFRLKLFGAVELSGNRQSDPYSLMFNAAYLCRLQFSLAFNYLALLKLPKATAYSRSVGNNMALVPHLNAYLPVLLLLFAAATLFNTFERLLRVLGVDEQGSPRVGNAEDDETIRAGQVLTRRGRHTASARRRAGPGPGLDPKGSRGRRATSSTPGGVSGGVGGGGGVAGVGNGLGGDGSLSGLGAAATRDLESELEAALATSSRPFLEPSARGLPPITSGIPIRASLDSFASGASRHDGAATGGSSSPMGRSHVPSGSRRGNGGYGRL